MAAPTTPTLTITQGGDPVTAGETITRGAVLVISLTGSTIPGSTEAAPDAPTGLTITEIAPGAEQAPDAPTSLTLTEV